MNPKSTRLVDELNQVGQRLQNASDVGDLNKFADQFETTASNVAETITPSGAEKAKLMLMVGQQLTQKGLFLRAIRWFLDGRNEAETARNDELIAFALTQLAQLYASIHRLDLAADHAKTLEDRFPNLLDVSTAAMFLVYRGYFLIDSTDFEKAQDLLDRGERMLASDIDYAAARDLIRLLKAKLIALQGNIQEARRIVDRLEAPNRVPEEFMDEVRQLIRRDRSPYSVPCVHRVLERAFGQFSFAPGGHPRFEEPTADTKLLHVTSQVPENLRGECESVKTELAQDFVGVKYSASHGSSPPGMLLGIKIHHTANVEAFRAAWELFKHEETCFRRFEKLANEWATLRGRVRYVPNAPFHGTPQEFANYASCLVENAEASADVALTERCRNFSMYAGNFLEATSDDPVLAIFMWFMRNRLLAAANRLTSRTKRELVFQFSISIEAILELLKSADRDNENGGRSLASMVLQELLRNHELLLDNRHLGSVQKLLDYISQCQLESEQTVNLHFLLSLIANGQGRPDLSVQYADKAVERGNNAGKRINVQPELAVKALRVRAASRLKSLASSAHEMSDRLGPFAPFIGPEADESLSWQDFQSSIPDEVCRHFVASGTSLERTLGYSDGCLVVIDKSLKGHSVMLHEVQHALRRAGGQILKTADGRWLKVRRDVPIASATTFLDILDDPKWANEMGKAFDVIRGLSSWGEERFQRQPELAKRNILAMLAYFDDLALVESKSSYACGAVFCGMALALFNGDRKKVHSYLNYLSVVEHDEAVAAGYAELDLKL